MTHEYKTYGTYWEYGHLFGSDTWGAMETRLLCCSDTLAVRGVL